MYLANFARYRHEPFQLKNRLPLCQIIDNATLVCGETSSFPKIKLTVNDVEREVWVCEKHRKMKLKGEEIKKREKLAAPGILDLIFVPLPSFAFFKPPKEIWLPVSRVKGLVIHGTFTRKNGQIVMEMRFQNNAMQAMNNFAIQLNMNSFGLEPASPLNIHIPIQPNAGYDVILPLNNNLGLVQKMQYLTYLQFLISNNIGVFYFNCVIPMHVFCIENGKLEKSKFLDTWNEIPPENEVQYLINIGTNTIESLQNKLQSNNIFTIINGKVDGQNMLYQSFQLVDNTRVLTELEIQPGNQQATLSIKCRSLDVAQPVAEMFELLINI